MNRSLWTTVAVLLLLLQPVVQPALAHGGSQGGHDHPTDGSSDGSSDGSGASTQEDPREPPPNTAPGPSAEPLTPDARFVDQRNPFAHGSMVVWQERKVGRDWDVMAYNLTTGGPAFPVTLSDADERNPVVQGPWIVWEEHADRANTTNLVALNLDSGKLINVPDTGYDDVSATISRGILYWMSVTEDDANHPRGHLRAFDLHSQRLKFPIGNVTIQAPPSAWGPYLTWGQGQAFNGKIHLMDTRTGETRQVPNLWNLREGPMVSPWGIAWISVERKIQPGTYVTLYNWTEDSFHRFLTGRYPHKHLGVCDTGVIWDQFSAANELPSVAVWDGYRNKITEFGSPNYDGTCSGDHFIYEKEVNQEDSRLGKTFRLYQLDLQDARLPAKPKVLADPGLERGLFRAPVTFSGRIVSEDPREDVAKAWYAVDGGERKPLELERRGDAWHWQVTVDPTKLLSGQHALKIFAETERRGTDVHRIVFFSSATYTTDERVFEQGLEIPRKPSTPFPFNVLNHYQEYRAFYNTLILGLLAAALVGYLSWRWWENRPRGRPELVRPDPEQPEEQEATAPQKGGPSSSVAFQQPDRGRL